MKYETFNRQIIELVGGKENISAVVHCMTRLRFTLHDKSKAKTEEIQKMDGVIDVVSNDVAYQIIIGTHVAEVHEELIAMLGLSGEALKQSDAPKAKKNPFKAALDLVSESMTPLLEPIIAAGMLAGLMSLVSLTGLISAESPTYMVLDSIRGAVFFFLPIFMAMSCASRLNASPYLAGALGAGSMVYGIRTDIFKKDNSKYASVFSCSGIYACDNAACNIDVFWADWDMDWGRNRMVL